MKHEVWRHLAFVFFIASIAFVAPYGCDCGKKNETDAGAFAPCEVGSPNCPADQVCQPVKGLPPEALDGGPDGGIDAGAICRPPCDPNNPATCAETYTCSRRADGKYACYRPVLFKGKITDALTGAPIPNAHVHAADDTGVSVTDIAISDQNGDYTLSVPVLRKDDGTIESSSPQVFTLRVSAAKYQRFPFGVRPALPIDATKATEGDEAWVVDNAATQVALIPLPANQQNGGTLKGSVKITDDKSLPGGVLVVAESADGKQGASVGFSDRAGNFTLFNVPAGSWTLRGYRAGLQLAPATATATANQVTDGIVLSQTSKALSTVTGSINIVNSPGGAATSVVLVPVSTFNEIFKNGDVPPGLRAPKAPAAPSITGNFTIEGVPDGTYKVLAAFENDRLVRDPDPGIAGTQIVEIKVPETTTVPTSFKITEALVIQSPGATEPEPISGTPTFTWANDSSEDNYSIVVFDAFGNEVWRNDTITPPKGSKPVSVQYGGPALQPGMYYQFRATSFRKGGPISQTEDLLGVFYIKR